MPKIKDGEYIIKLDDYESIKCHWMALHADVDNVTYFDRFGVEYITKEIKSS